MVNTEMAKVAAPQPHLKCLPVLPVLPVLQVLLVLPVLPVLPVLLSVQIGRAHV